MTQRAIHGDFVYFVTFNVDKRRWFFVTPQRADVLGRAIRTSCKMKRFVLSGYCILPNHVHMMVMPETMMGNVTTSQRTLERVRCKRNGIIPDDKYLFQQRRLSSRRCGRAERYNLSQLMQSIKGSYSRTLPKGKFWQHRSNFRLVTSQEDFNNKINYIAYNYRKMYPVRASCVDSVDWDFMRKIIRHRSNGMDLPESFGQAPWVYLNWRAIHHLL